MTRGRDLQPALDAVLNPKADPRDREALRRILTTPMPPGTDYPSAAWGAASVLLLLRTITSEETL